MEIVFAGCFEKMIIVQLATQFNPINADNIA